MCSAQSLRSRNRLACIELPSGGVEADTEIRLGHFDLVILGSGSTAFAAAIRAAELGKTAAMTENRTLGGTCVNRGCLPSKNLIAAAGIIHDAAHPRYPGIEPARLRGGKQFSRGALYHLLSNPIYLGEIRHKHERHPGQHEAIVRRELWERVQQRLRAQGCAVAKVARPKRRTVRWQASCSMKAASGAVRLRACGHVAPYPP
jgi:recombinase/pyridine nucleotide-disulfide oxidoreductase